MFALPGITALLMESCASVPMVKVKLDTTVKEFTIPIAKFEKSKLVIVRVKNFAFDLLIIKKSETEFKTLELKCSHEDQPLTMSNKNIFCTSHGSVFDFEGNALKEPASKPLKSFKTKLVNRVVIITLR